MASSSEVKSSELLSASSSCWLHDASMGCRTRLRSLGDSESGLFLTCSFLLLVQLSSLLGSPSGTYSSSQQDSAELEAPAESSTWNYEQVILYTLHNQAQNNKLSNISQICHANSNCRYFVISTSDSHILFCLACSDSCLTKV